MDPISGRRAIDVTESSPSEVEDTPAPAAVAPPHIRSSGRQHFTGANSVERSRREGSFGRGGAFGEETKDRIADALTRGLDNWVIGEEDVNRVQAELESLGDPDFRKAIAWMDGEGHLAIFTEGLDAAQRDAFLRTAHDKGMVETAPARTNSGPAQPPETPEVFINRKHLPAALREAIHEHTVGVNQAYAQAYEEYLGRYEAAVRAAGSRHELVALGPVASPKAPREPGVEYGHPDQKRFDKDRTERMPTLTTLAAQQALTDKIAILRGQPRGGSLFLDIKSETKLGDATLKSQGRFYSDGGGGDKAKVEAEANVGGITGGIGVGVGDKVKWESKVGLKTEDAKITIAEKQNGESTVEQKVGPAFQKVERNPDGTLKHWRAGLDVGLIKAVIGDDYLELKLKVPGATVGTVMDLEKAELSGSVGLKLGASKVEMGAGWKGIEEGVGPHAVTSMGFDAIPRELEAGKAWDALPKEAREYYGRSGWKKDEWEEALKARGH